MLHTKYVSLSLKFMLKWILSYTSSAEWELWVWVDRILGKVRTFHAIKYTYLHKPRAEAKEDKYDMISSSLSFISSFKYLQSSKLHFGLILVKGFSRIQ